MVQMPDFNALGARPIAQSTRGMVSYGSRPEFAALGNLGNDIQDIAVSYQNDADDYDYAQAKSLLLQDKVRLEREATEDNDFLNYTNKFTTGFEDTRKKVSSIIKNPERRKLFELEAGTLYQEGFSKLDSLAKNKEKDFGRANLLSTNDSNIRTAVQATDEKTAAESIKASNQLIDGGVARGYYTYEQGVKLKMENRERYANFKLDALPPEESIKLLAPNIPQPEANNIIQKLQTRSQEFGLSPDYLVKVAGLESGFDPNAVNPDSGASGLFQYVKSTAKEYALIDPKNPEQSIATTGKLSINNKKTLISKLGREPEDSELYLAHQQGATGASALIKGGNENAIDVLERVYGSREKASKAILQNRGDTNMTASEFVAQWKNEYDVFTPEEYEVVGLNQRKNSWVDFAAPAVKRRILKDSGEKIKTSELKQQAQDISDNISTQFPDDFQAQVQASLSIPDAEIRERVITNVSKMHEIKSKADEGQYNARQARVMDVVNQGGSLDDIPTEDYAVLPVKDKESVQKLLRKKALNMSFPIDEQESKNESIFYNKVNSEYSENPKSIKNYSAIELAANLPMNKADEWLAIREDYLEKEKAGEVKIDVERNQINNIYKDTLKILDIPTGEDVNDDDAIRASKLRDTLETSIDSFKLQNRRTPNMNELIEIRDSLIKKYVNETGYFDASLDAEMSPFEIPIEDRRQIITSLSSKGYNVTEDLIAKTYMRVLSANR